MFQNAKISVIGYHIGSIGCHCAIDILVIVRIIVNEGR